MALIDATVNFYSAVPGTTSLDGACTPFTYSIPDTCLEPVRDEWDYDPSVKPFPSSK